MISGSRRRCVRAPADQVRVRDAGSSRRCMRAMMSRRGLRDRAADDGARAPVRAIGAGRGGDVVELAPHRLHIHLAAIRVRRHRDHRADAVTHADAHIQGDLAADRAADDDGMRHLERVEHPDAELRVVAQVRDRPAGRLLRMPVPRHVRDDHPVAVGGEFASGVAVLDAGLPGGVDREDRETVDRPPSPGRTPGGRRAPAGARAARCARGGPLRWDPSRRRSSPRPSPAERLRRRRRRPWLRRGMRGGRGHAEAPSERAVSVAAAG